MYIFDTIMNRMAARLPDHAVPQGSGGLPDRHGGALRLDASRCPEAAQCAHVCPVEAITVAPDCGTRLDLGRCLFCGDCVQACPHGAITRTNDHRLATRRREDLILGGTGAEELRLAEALDKKMKSLFGRSCACGKVSAGGCGACEADINVLGTIGWDLGRFGIQYVASPRHADGVLHHRPRDQRHGTGSAENLGGRAANRASPSPSAPAPSAAAPLLDTPSTTAEQAPSSPSISTSPAAPRTP